MTGRDLAQRGDAPGRARKMQTRGRRQPPRNRRPRHGHQGLDHLATSRSAAPRLKLPAVHDAEPTRCSRARPTAFFLVPRPGRSGGDGAPLVGPCGS